MSDIFVVCGYIILIAVTILTVVLVVDIVKDILQ